ncbi:MAG: thioredoxin domain-containing protein [Gemmatimonadaceae bacterium]|nr:thioredoxin domain-containing protein [Gemmatimonadaceae bacterium]
MRIVEWSAAVSAICAVLVTGLVVRERLADPEPQRPETQDLEILRSWGQYAETGHSRGPRAAPATLVEFSDFECPFCRELSALVRVLETREPGRIRRVFRHYPLRTHPYARTAALASECAAEDGRFWEYHDSVFASAGPLDFAALTRIARDIGVRDVRLFTQCLRTQKHAGRISQDSAAAATLAITGTPLVIVNGRIVRGAPSLPVLDSLLRLGPPSR